MSKVYLIPFSLFILLFSGRECQEFQRRRDRRRLGRFAGDDSDDGIRVGGRRRRRFSPERRMHPRHPVHPGGGVVLAQFQDLDAFPSHLFG